MTDRLVNSEEEDLGTLPGSVTMDRGRQYVLGIIFAHPRVSETTPEYDITI
jgi:hypothetical protein